ncbi:MAG: hypothetical protein ACR2QB_03525 [Gammaproteobacteria bacterium]
MSLRIFAVENRRQLRDWVGLPYLLYRDAPNFVPQLRREQLNTFDARRNPAFRTAQVRLLLAERDGRILGRVCGLVNELETGKLGYRRGRFGWFECVDDQQVAGALLDAVQAWLREQGCVEMTGPHGFTDLDPEGVLLDGFEVLPTISGSFNFSYYPQLLENYGLTKDADYIEFRIAVPDRMPLFERLRKRLAKQTDYRVHTCKSRKELKSYLPSLWKILEDSFEPLYGVVPLTAQQRDYYTEAYFGFLDPDFVKLVFNQAGDMVGFFLAMPSLSEAFQRARGRLFPVGFWHLLRAFRRPKTVDFLLAAARPGEPSTILAPLGLIAIFDTLRERGVEYVETNHELEENTTVNQVWSKMTLINQRRSRVYRLPLD